MANGNGAHPVEGRCGAKLRGTRAGKFCTSFPMASKRRCRMHGGPSTGPKRNANRRHGAYEIVSDQSRSPMPKPNAMARMTPPELARLEGLKSASDLEILDGHLRILVIARERLTPDHIDAHVKLAMAEGRIIEAKARLAPRRIELSGPEGAPIRVTARYNLSALTDEQLAQVEAAESLLVRSYVDDDADADRTPTPDAR